MYIQLYCNNCRKLIHFTYDRAGKKDVCIHCGTIIEVPLAQPAPAMQQPLAAYDPLAPTGAPLGGAAPQYGPAPIYADPNMVKAHRGGLVLALGIVGLLLAVATPIVCVTMPFALAACMTAVVMGRKDLNAIDDEKMSPQGRDMTYYGYIMGFIGAVISIIGLGCFAICFMLSGMSAGIAK